MGVWIRNRMDEYASQNLYDQIKDIKYDPL